MCRVFEVHEQGYYQWRKVKQDLKAKRKKRLCVLIRRIFYSHKRRYGSPRVWKELRKSKVKCSENRTAWLMAEMGLVAKGAPKFKVTTMPSRSEMRAKRIEPTFLQGSLT
jgi:transposase InsO family protein